MNMKTIGILGSIGFIVIGIGIGIIIMGLFVPSAEQMIDACNSQFGVGNWNVTMIDNEWYCTGTEILYYDIDDLYYP